MNSEPNQIQQQLAAVQSTMHNCLRETNLSKIIPTKNSIIGSGKMLRARLTLAIGASTDAPEKQLIHSAATVEIIHGASLLHDDVIDGGLLRRGAPTFWKKHGVNGAILLGDLLVFKALQLLSDESCAHIQREIINMSATVCQSEVQQELILRGTPGSWEECEKIARQKTGALFAFAAYAAAGSDLALQTALREAGFVIGTAYQLVDDILDTSENELIAGKTLGKDQERGKTTAITATRNAPANPLNYIKKLCADSATSLTPWPDVQQSWNTFLKETMYPVLETHLSAHG